MAMRAGRSTRAARGAEGRADDVPRARGDLQRATRDPEAPGDGENFTWTVKPFMDRFGDRALGDIRTADVQDFIADLRKPRAVHRRGVRVLVAQR